MSIEYLIYEDGVIAVMLLAENEVAAQKSLFTLAMRYLPPGSYRDKSDSLVKMTNCMGGETDWFILPYSFSVAIGRYLIEQKTAGLLGFSDDGFTKMVNWMIEMEEIPDAMCY
jgi:hypothetical protein